MSFLPIPEERCLLPIGRSALQALPATNHWLDSVSVRPPYCPGFELWLNPTDSVTLGFSQVTTGVPAATFTITGAQGAIIGINLGAAWNAIVTSSSGSPQFRWM